MLMKDKVELDDDLTCTFDNNVKVIFCGLTERHINVTHAGITIDLVRDGEVVATRVVTHEELLTEEG